MRQPVKLSDDLVLDARLTGRNAGRSIAGQIEYWAKLGRAIEPLLLRTMGTSSAGGIKSISGLLESVDSTAGYERFAEHLRSQPSPHYKPFKETSGNDGLLVRITPDGKRQIGRFVNRQFEEADGL